MSNWGTPVANYRLSITLHFESLTLCRGFLFLGDRAIELSQLRQSFEQRWQPPQQIQGLVDEEILLFISNLTM
ncbi:hypothetical protein [Microcoleus sp. MON2_D5]|uniref:hypothetical protein n=1 Tax=Microcoleus sp. MON2_D5 TaxID=2818833 RepID=UPI002FD08607